MCCTNHNGYCESLIGEKKRSSRTDRCRAMMGMISSDQVGRQNILGKRSSFDQRDSDMCDSVAVKVGSTSKGGTMIPQSEVCTEKKNHGHPSQSKVVRLFLGKAYGTGRCILLNCSDLF